MEASVGLSARSVAKHKSSPMEVDEGRAVLVNDTLDLLGMVIIFIVTMIKLSDLVDSNLHLPQRSSITSRVHSDSLAVALFEAMCMVGAVVLALGKCLPHHHHHSHQRHHRHHQRHHRHHCHHHYHNNHQHYLGEHLPHLHNVPRAEVHVHPAAFRGIFIPSSQLRLKLLNARQPFS